MVRECRPPAREPGRSWLARRSTIATSTPANASSPANISPVGPPPALSTACSVTRIRTSIFYAPTERRERTTSVGSHEDAPNLVNDEDCTDVDEQKKSGLDLFYFVCVYAIVKTAREYEMGDQSGRPLCWVKDANK